MADPHDLKENGYEVGYKVAGDMLDCGAFPTSRALTRFDIHLYAEVATSVLGFAEPNMAAKWRSDFEQGYRHRLERYQTLGTCEIQQWKRGGEFGVANAPTQFEEQFIQWGGRKEPAHYGIIVLSERFRQNSWIFPVESYEPVVALLKRAYQEELARQQEQEGTKIDA